MEKCIHQNNKSTERLNSIVPRIDPTKFYSHVKPWLRTNMTAAGWHCRLHMKIPKEGDNAADKLDKATEAAGIKIYYRYAKAKARTGLLGGSSVKGLFAKKTGTDWVWEVQEGKKTFTTQKKT